MRGNSSIATYAAGTIVVGKCCARSRRSFHALERSAGRGDDIGNEAGAAVLARVGDHRGVGHVVERHERDLHLAGRDHRAADLHARVEPAEVLVQPVRSLAATVGRAEPEAAVGEGEERLRCEFRVAPVAARERSVAHDDEASRLAVGDRPVVLVDQADLHPGLRRAGGDGLGVGLGIGWDLVGDDEADLGRTEVVHEHGVGADERAREHDVAPLQRFRDECEPTQAAHRPGRGRRREGAHDARRELDRRDAVVTDPSGHAAGAAVAEVVHATRRAVEEAGEDLDLGGGEAPRRGDRDAVARHQALAPVPGAPLEDVAVRLEEALGRSGRARREQDLGRGVRRDVDLGGRRAVRRGLVEEEHVIAQRSGRLGVRPIGQDPLCTAQREQSAQTVNGLADVSGRSDQPRVQHAADRDRRCDPGVAQDEHGHRRVEPTVEQRSCNLRGARVEVGECDLVVAGVDGDAVGDVRHDDAHRRGHGVGDVLEEEVGVRRLPRVEGGAADSARARTLRDVGGNPSVGVRSNLASGR